MRIPLMAQQFVTAEKALCTAVRTAGHKALILPGAGLVGLGVAVEVGDTLEGAATDGVGAGVPSWCELDGYRGGDMGARGGRGWWRRPRRGSGLVGDDVANRSAVDGARMSGVSSKVVGGEDVGRDKARVDNGAEVMRPHVQFQGFNLLEFGSTSLE